MSMLDVLPLVDHNALRSFALTSRAMRARGCRPRKDARAARAPAP